MFERGIGPGAHSPEQHEGYAPPQRESQAPRARRIPQCLPAVATTRRAPPTRQGRAPPTRQGDDVQRKASDRLSGAVKRYGRSKPWSPAWPSTVLHAQEHPSHRADRQEAAPARDEGLLRPLCVQLLVPPPAPARPRRPEPEPVPEPGPGPGPEPRPAPGPEPEPRPAPGPAPGA